MTDNTIPSGTLGFVSDDDEKQIIKVVGVGGGGCNAVDNMYHKGIHNVSFMICNTDRQALNNSSVPVRLQLGEKGLGAGSNPELGKEEAEKSADAIREAFSDGTEMVFITAGMGGGTGTGAAPVIAKIAKDMGKLTIGIVTIPFLLEGEKRILKALAGVSEMSKNVDAILVINNERLKEIYIDSDNDDFDVALANADDILCVAARSIAEIITVSGRWNVDFRDVQAVMRDSGVAIMGMGDASGEGRMIAALESALHSPLLSSNDIFNAKNILISISYTDKDSGGKGLKMSEINELETFMTKFKHKFDYKMGVKKEADLDDKIKVIVLATGFGMESLSHIQEVDQLQQPKQPDPDDMEETKKRIIGELYGNFDMIKKKKRNHKVYVFDNNELDNEEVIMAVEESPAYLRDAKKIEEIKKYTYVKDVEQNEETATNDEPQEGFIQFV